MSYDFQQILTELHNFLQKFDQNIETLKKFQSESFLKSIKFFMISTGIKIRSIKGKYNTLKAK